MTALAEALQRIRLALVEEATPQPGQQLAYGRPHEHPRSRFYARYSPTGERLEGSVRVRPDCPRPVKGRCECPPDGSWRPSVGVVRADATARHAVSVPATRLRLALEGHLWVDEVYEQGPDGLWRCRRPMRRALERQRGANTVDWSVAVRLLAGDHLSGVWGARGVPPGPEQAAVRILDRLERWAQEERETEWERRPRQWWDPPRKPRQANERAESKSESQSVAEHEGNVTMALQSPKPAATLPATGRVSPLSRSTASDAASVEQPSETMALRPARFATASPAEAPCV